jgi:cellobiose phosphorylase
MDYYKRIAYATKSRIADVHGTEPYVYSQHIGLPPWYHVGRAGNPWLTGSATWSMLALSQWILGVRPVWGGLLVDPCVPRSWKKFRVEREYRGAMFQIQVENLGVEKGVKEVVLDGKRLDGQVVPPQEAGSMHRVKVVMG